MVRTKELKFINWLTKNQYKAKIILLARYFCKNGMFEEARRLHGFLNNKRMVLDISDVDWNVQTALEAINIYPDACIPSRWIGTRDEYILKNNNLL